MKSDKTTGFPNADQGGGWDIPDSLSPDQRAQVEKLMASIKNGQSGLDHRWGRDGVEHENEPLVQTMNDQFTFTTNENGVTVNGKHYKNLDAVPIAERARIEVLQRQFSPESELMKQLHKTGKPVTQRTSTTTRGWATNGRTQSKTTHKTSTFASDDSSAPTQSGASDANSFGFTTAIPNADASPGAVPRKGGLRTLVQAVIVLAVVAALVLAARSAGIF